MATLRTAAITLTWAYEQHFNVEVPDEVTDVDGWVLGLVEDGLGDTARVDEMELVKIDHTLIVAMPPSTEVPGQLDWNGGEAP